MLRSPSSSLSIMLACCLGSVIGACASQSRALHPTPEVYVRKVGGEAKIIPSGQLDLDGHWPVCRTSPTVLDTRLDDYGGAYSDFLILNPRLLTTTTTTVKLWIYAHECGHQFRGKEELAADCFAVERGRQEKWLTPMGVEEICRFIAPTRANGPHPSGPERCAAMKLCYAKAL